MGHCERHAQDRIGPEARLVRSAVEVDQRVVDRLLVFDVGISQAPCYLALDVRDRPRDSLAAVTFGIAVTQLDSFVRAGRGAGRHDRAAAASVGEGGHRDRWIAARVEHLEGPQTRQTRHES